MSDKKFQSSRDNQVVEHDNRLYSLLGDIETSEGASSNLVECCSIK